MRVVFHSDRMKYFVLTARVISRWKRRKRRKRGSGKTAGRREEEGRREGDWGGSKKNPLHLVKDGADLLIVGGIRGGLLEKYFLAVLDDDALVVGTDGLTCKVVGWGIGC